MPTEDSHAHPQGHRQSPDTTDTARSVHYFLSSGQQHLSKDLSKDLGKGYARRRSGTGKPSNLP